MTGGAGECLDQVLLNRRQRILAAEISGDAFGDRVELPPCTRAPVEGSGGEQAGLDRANLAAAPFRLVSGVGGGLFLVYRGNIYWVVLVYNSFLGEFHWGRRQPWRHRGPGPLSERVYHG